MKDETPMTNDEGKRLRSLIEGGRFKLVDPRQTGLPKYLEQDIKNSVTRRLKDKRGGHTHGEQRDARIPRSGTARTRAGDGTGKKAKQTKAAGTTRSKPVDTTRHKGNHEHSTPKDTGRKKAAKTSRQDP
jgi:hypothetical protein